jgi:hypothetical protein
MSSPALTPTAYFQMTVPFPTLVSNLCDGTGHYLTSVGDRRGPRCSVYELCHPAPAQEAVPYLPSAELRYPWKASELECLKEVGAFASLPRDVSDELVRSYFQHVHSFLPVVDAARFLNEYVKNGAQHVNPLLFWSMALAATNVSCFTLAL